MYLHLPLSLGMGSIGVEPGCEDILPLFQHDPILPYHVPVAQISSCQLELNLLLLSLLHINFLKSPQSLPGELDVRLRSSWIRHVELWYNHTPDTAGIFHLNADHHIRLPEVRIAALSTTGLGWRPLDVVAL